MYRLFFFLFVSSSYATDWIAIRESHHHKTFKWTQLAEKIRTQFRFVDSFGPEDRFGLFRSRHDHFPPKLPGIYWQKNLNYRALGDPEIAKSWGLENTGNNPGPKGIKPGLPGADVGAKKAWEIERPGNTLIAILDTGVDIKYEEFGSNLQKNISEIPNDLKDNDQNGFIDDIYGWNFINDNANVQDDNGHGTTVSAITAALADNNKGSRGIYKGPLFIVKMLDKNGNGTTDTIVRAIQYAVNRGAKIINASWGGIVYDQALYETVKWVGEKGLLFVTAAGNLAKNNDTDPNPVYPAAFRLPHIVTVAAYNRLDELDTFSNFGPETVDIGAPGVEIFAPKQDMGDTVYGFAEGTSFAAPFVSGILAMGWNQFPSLDAQTLKAKLLKSSVPIHYYERYHTRSGGRVNAYNLLAGIEPERPKVPKQWLTYKTLLQSEHPYVPNTKFVHTITHPGATHLRVHFSKFELENTYDFVTIKDKQNKVVGVYSGIQNALTTNDVLGDTLKIEFISDHVAQHWGFEIDSYEISTEP